MMNAIRAKGRIDSGRTSANVVPRLNRKFMNNTYDNEAGPKSVGKTPIRVGNRKPRKKRSTSPTVRNSNVSLPMGPIGGRDRDRDHGDLEMDENHLK